MKYKNIQEQFDMCREITNVLKIAVDELDGCAMDTTHIYRMAVSLEHEIETFESLLQELKAKNPIIDTNLTQSENNCRVMRWMLDRHKGGGSKTKEEWLAERILMEKTREKESS